MERRHFEGHPDPASSEPQRKPEERRQAQADLFAGRLLASLGGGLDADAILRHAGELASITDLEHLPESLPEWLRALVERHKDEYVRFLREERGRDREAIESLIRAYKDRFQAAVREMRSTLPRYPKNAPNYLGTGAFGNVFRLDLDGRGYAVKFARSGSRDSTVTRDQMLPLLRANGVPRAAQVVAYSSEDQVVIMDLCAGSPVGEHRPDGSLEYQDDHLSGLIDTIRALDARGLTLDNHSHNLMYDAAQGFSVLDFHMRHPYAEDVAAVMRHLPTVLADAFWRDPMSRFEARGSDIEAAYHQRMEEIRTQLMAVLHRDHPDLEEQILQREAQEKSDRDELRRERGLPPA